MSQAEKAPNAEIGVSVTFPVAAGPPFKGDFGSDTAVGAIRDAAMSHFKVTDDGQTAYVLAHAGDEIDNATTIGTVAGNAKHVQFRLIKKIVQG